MKILTGKFALSLLLINYILAIILFLLCAFFDYEARADMKVMVIDTGIGRHHLLDGNVQYDDSDDYEDVDGHGTHVAGIVVLGNENRDEMRPKLDPICHQVKVYSCRYYSSHYWFMTVMNAEHDRLMREIACIKRATREGMSAINISGGGGSYQQAEYDALKAYIESGGWVITSAGNLNKSLTELPFYPASYGVGFKEKARVKEEIKGEHGSLMTMEYTTVIDKFPPLKHIVVVESTERNGEITKNSNTAPGAAKEIGVDIVSTFPDNKFGRLSGTSMAAPAFLHKLLKLKCKQMEESHVIRSSSSNTGGIYSAGKLVRVRHTEEGNDLACRSNRQSP